MENDFKKIKRKRPQSIAERLRNDPQWQAASAVILPVVLGIVILILWQTQVLHTLFRTDTFTLPLVSKIGNIMFDIREKLWANTLDTIKVAFIGLAIGSLLGYAVAVLTAMFPQIGSAGLSIIGAFASIPVVAMAPVLNNWTKDVSKDASVRSMVAKILVVVLIAAANMGLNAYRGLSELKPFSEDLMKIYAAPRIVVLFKLRIPNSVPFIFTALKVSVPASIMTAIVSEYFAEYITGVGRQIRENIVLAQYSTAWAYIATACLIGIVSYAVLMIFQSILLRKYK